MDERTDLEHAIRHALRDPAVRECSIMVRTSSQDLHEVVATSADTFPLTYVIGGPNFRIYGLSEEDVMKEISRLGVPASVRISRPRR